MKKRMIALILFIFVFLATYLIICFAIPGMKIKLDAAPMEYFYRSILHMAFFKTMISLAAALICGAIPLLIRKKQ